MEMREQSERLKTKLLQTEELRKKRLGGKREKTESLDSVEGRYQKI